MWEDLGTLLPATTLFRIAPLAVNEVIEDEICFDLLVDMEMEE